MTAEQRDGNSGLCGMADVAFHLALVRATDVDEVIRRHSSVMKQTAAPLRQIPATFIPTQRDRHQEILDVLADSQRQRKTHGILRLMSTHLLTTRADVEGLELPQ
ncbi:hypothetical protein [Curtobacterium sp. AB7]|uniref:hypothetical protein n=1 Tax=Curtobacterium sp. AB7 TaxID=3349327 RepID=UPI00383531BF